MQNPSFYLAFLLAVSMAAASSAQLEVGFYDSTCPSAESTIYSVVSQAIASNPGLGAGLIRLLFHDCFVNGCDGSVLIASTASNPSEQASPIDLSLRGFSVIDQAKSELEAACPGIVSCADIVAFAARDSVYELGGPNYTVAAGRRDGSVSNEAAPLENLPQFNMTLPELISTFAAKGLTETEMVVLSGAHTVGEAHCSSFTNRLYPTVDPTLNSTFARSLLSLCPSSDTSVDNPTTSLDLQTPNVFDNQYYQDILNSEVLLTSDEDLVNSTDTLSLVQEFSSQGGVWYTQFVAAMQKMGQIDVLTGTDGNIRLNCSVFNS
ncbi:hypothetical protein Dimus_012037 [Dionaea muscipula]